MASGLPIGSDALIEPAMLAALAAGRVATTVSLANADELAIVRAGSYVDLWAGGSGGDLVEGKPAPAAASAPVASGVQVLSVLSGTAEVDRAASPTLIVAADRPLAARLGARAGTTFLATLVAPP